MAARLQVLLLTALVVTILSPTTAANEDELFESRIRPVLIETCFVCHGGQTTESGLTLNSRDSLLAGGDRGPAVVPGDAKASLLMRAIRRAHEDLAMPPAKPLPEMVIADFERWINAGAPWPDEVTLESATNLRKSSHWSFRPLAKPDLAVVRDSEWPQSPIDYFVLSKLEEKALTPNDVADKHILLRRVFIDLTGLPPSPDDAEAFNADISHNSLERVVDRLLASPAYGERMGRYWLDVVRYSDTAGNPPDFPIPQAFRYRNYVIESFASDMPFNQFVREQIAGDLLEAATQHDRQRQIIATGYLAIGRRYFGTKDGPDHFEIEDVIQTMGTSFLGLSLGCCRCHDHKFDPISQREYYSLYGIFSSTHFAQPGAEGNAKQENFIPLPDGTDAYAVTDGTGANARIQIGGDPGAVGDEVPRGFLQVLGGEQLSSDAQGSGRKMLADWLTDSQQNPLLARVIVNRIWQHHFGTGLVRTPNDFGLRGSPPSHKELLDYLACELIESGWSIKALQRQIVLSRTYQLSSREQPHNWAIDPTNEWLWRHARRRLDAECIRDALLEVSASLDRSPGTEHPFPPQQQRNYSQHAPFADVYDTNRRSVYLMQQRLKRHPLLSLFDAADANVSTGIRASTTTPIQSLFWMNDAFVHTQSEHFANRLMRERSETQQRIRYAFQLAFSREPSMTETEACSTHLARYEESARALNAPEHDLLRQSWASLARVLFASNEFLYVD